MTNNSQITAEWMRRPLADLNNMSPAEAAGDAGARRKLEDLLTELAGHYVRLTNLGLPAVDPQEIRKALGLAAAPVHPSGRHAQRPLIRAGPVKRNALLEELGSALTGGDVDSVAFFNRKTGAIDHFMYNLGEQEDAKIAQAESTPDLTKVTPVTTEVRYSIMSDFIGSLEDINVAGRLRAAISGKGAFRRFREAVDEDDSLRRRWLAYRTKRHYYIALDWLHQLGLKAEQYGINTSDYDWKPAAAAGDRAAAAQGGQGAPPKAEHAGGTAPESGAEETQAPEQQSGQADAGQPAAEAAPAQHPPQKAGMQSADAAAENSADATATESSAAPDAQAAQTAASPDGEAALDQAPDTQPDPAGA